MTADGDIWVGLGSNLGEPVAQLRAAFEALTAIPQTRLTARSALYRNPPMGPSDQPDYVNAVARLATGLQPLELLDALQAIEADHGRRRERRWGPRTLDLDLLLWGQRTIDLPRLTVPHPGLPERAFVLYPLAEIAPELHIPGHGALRHLLAAVDGGALVRIDGAE